MKRVLLENNDITMARICTCNWPAPNQLEVLLFWKNKYVVIAGTGHFQQNAELIYVLSYRRSPIKLKDEKSYFIFKFFC